MSVRRNQILPGNQARVITSVYDAQVCIVFVGTLLYRAQMFTCRRSLKSLTILDLIKDLRLLPRPDASAMMEDEEEEKRRKDAEKKKIA